MKLTSVLAPAPRDTEKGHSACSPFGGHRTLAAYPRCSADPGQARRLVAGLLSAAFILFAVPAVAQDDLAGTWTGRTSEGQELTLTVVRGGVSAVKIGVVFQLDEPCPGKSKQYTFDHRAGVAKVKYKVPVAVKDGRFQLAFQAPDMDVALSGEFSGDSAHGVWSVQASRESGCKGRNEGTWSLAKRGGKGRRTSG